MEKFNTTHTIQGLSFGHLPPFEHASSKHIAASTLLEGHHKTVQDTHAMHQVRRFETVLYREAFRNGFTNGGGIWVILYALRYW